MSVGRRCGLEHRSPMHMNAVEPDVSAKVAQVYTRHSRRGDFYFHSAAVRYDRATQDWYMVRGIVEDTENSVPTAHMNITDKIKVMHSSFNTRNVVRQHTLTGKEGVEDRKSNSYIESFPQEVSKSTYPVSTTLGCKRVDTARIDHAYGLLQGDANINTTNVNMPRGFLEHVMNKQLTATHHTLLNPGHARMEPLVWRDSEFNNSLTSDSFISAVVNDITFKKRATIENSKGRFQLVNKARFRTHKVVELPYDEETEADVIRRYHKDEATKGMQEDCEILWRAALRPLECFELQVYSRCFNGSAVPGYPMVPIMCRKGGQMLHESNGKNVQISLALNNAKATTERLFHSLVWREVNAFLDLLCWTLKTHEKTKEEEQRLFHQKILPIVSKLVGSRATYSQATNFALPNISWSRVLGESITKLVSQKYKRIETINMFKRVEPRYPDIIIRYADKNHKPRNPARKRSFSEMERGSPTSLPPTMGQGVDVTEDETDDIGDCKGMLVHNGGLMPPMPRNASLVRMLELGYQCFRDRFDLPYPKNYEI
ncbi:PREDICTED: uncharacterized protein LOC109473283 [Branchiostoma belcheri]|uniref:Uncharacterized protein LOC109473283 n=1 Tax=Branchiostoma belcheri TaxID=7741 RepID=A0A6P4YWK6_BRABE|nr:PREDICTED: uncharacterized protein LOC109473283 [Branchiostoma belcheri]